MTANPVNEAMTLMLQADDEVGRCLAIGELFERLLRAAGQRQDDIGKIAAAVVLLWRGDHSSEEHVESARQRALTALKTADLNVRHLTMLATVGRALQGAALELQGEQLLAEQKKADAEYVPEEDDWAIWLGKHIVRVHSVQRSTLVDGHGHEDHIDQVIIRTAGQQTIPVSPRELELYRRDGEGPAGDFGLVSG